MIRWAGLGATEGIAAPAKWIIITAGSFATLGWASIRILVLVYPAFPASTPAWAVAAALAISVSLGAIFGVLPARRAMRLDPVAALAGR